MTSLNKFCGIGNLTKDPEVRATQNGSKVANFSIAINESYNDKQGQKVDKVEYVRLVAWSKLADIIERYLKKGSLVYVEGKLTTRSWEDNGQKKYVTEIVVNNLQMLGGGQNQDKSSYQASPNYEAPENGKPYDPWS